MCCSPARLVIYIPPSHRPPLPNHPPSRLPHQMVSSTFINRNHHQRTSVSSDGLRYQPQFFYNHPSLSKMASPPLSSTPLSHPSSYVGREGPVQDPYRAIADDSRRLRRVRQQQQQARQHYARRSLDCGATTPVINSDEEYQSGDDDEFDEDELHYPGSVSMRRLGSNGSARQHRSRTLSGGSATSSIAFAAPPSPRVSGSPSTTSVPLPMWPTTSSSSKYALPSYSPPDPSSPFTQSHLLFDDENESEDESERDRRASTTKTCAPTRRGAVIRLAGFTGRRESEHKRRPSLDLAQTNSVVCSARASVVSLADTVDS